jgi:hypothetical protein
MKASGSPYMGKIDEKKKNIIRLTIWLKFIINIPLNIKPKSSSVSATPKCSSMQLTAINRLIRCRIYIWRLVTSGKGFYQNVIF